MTDKHRPSKLRKATMATTKQPEQPTDRGQHQLEKRKALIRGQVLHALGEPGKLLQVQVRSLWENHFRVNVVVGPDVASARVAHSYFLEAGADGIILASTPEITKRY